MTETEYRQLPSHEYFSQSLLASFDKDGPSSLTKRKTDLDYKKQIRFGKICHHLALLEDSFEDSYQVSEYFPTESYLKITDMLINLYKDGAFTKEDILKCNESYSKVAYEMIMKSDIWNNIKKEDTVTAKVCDTAFANYLVDAIVAEEENKVLITSQEFLEAKEIADHLKKSDNLREYFVSKDIKERQILFEIPILYTIDEQKCKSMLDSIQIDHKNKTIRFSDLKITETPYTMFESLFIKMRRDIQSFMYTMALEEFMEKEGLKDYKVLDPIYIYAQRGNPKMCMPFKVTRPLVNRAYTGYQLGNRRYKGVKELIEEIQWHFKHKEFDLPKEYVEKGILRFRSLEENATTFIDSRNPSYRFYGVTRPEISPDDALSEIDISGSSLSALSQLVDMGYSPSDARTMLDDARRNAAMLQSSGRRRTRWTSSTSDPSSASSGSIGHTFTYSSNAFSALSSSGESPE